MLKSIERKVEGQEITEQPTEEPRAQVIDLMQALKASLTGKDGERKPARRAPRSAAKATSTKKKKVASKRSRS
jgi:DNA end-binding protein Ku